MMRMAAQHLPQDIVRPSSGLKELAQATTTPETWQPGCFQAYVGNGFDPLRTTVNAVNFLRVTEN